MARIPPVDEAAATANVRAMAEAHIAAGFDMSNMKWTLAHSPVAFGAVLDFYTVHAAVGQLVGPRRAWLFCHAISVQSECLNCSTLFRRLLIEAGDDPDTLVLDELDELIVRFGRQLAADAHGVDDALYGRLAERFTNEEIVLLTSSGAMMVATNVLNKALRVDLDVHLLPYVSGVDRV
jgi:alkylhydroperoxidase family enzyme